MANSFISDGTTHNGTFAAVVYSAFAGSSRLQMALSSQTTAAVIDAIVRSGPGRIARGLCPCGRRHATGQIQRADLEGVPISTNTLGIVYAAIAPARRSLAGEFTLLNAKTLHEQWPDMVVLAGVGVTTTLSNSLARD